MKKEAVNRILDANINRLKEGLRVCEEIARFILNSRTITADFKAIRHRVDALVRKIPAYPHSFLKARDSRKDVGLDVYGNELKRRDISDIFFANIQRVKESARVLEEFTKLSSKDIAVQFKKLRYEIYAIEKKLLAKISRK